MMTRLTDNELLAIFDREVRRECEWTRMRREVRSSRCVTSQIGNRTGGTSSRTRTMPGVAQAISSIIAPMPRPCCTSAQWVVVWST